MRLLEYQAKQLFSNQGISTPRGILCRSLEEIEREFPKFPDGAVLKAQVPSGKRGKGGGIKIVSTKDEALDFADFLFGANICGFQVDCILMEEKIALAKEYYLSVITDTESRYSGPMVLFTVHGGMDIEEMLTEHPEYLQRINVDPRYGLMDFQVRRLIKEADVPAAEQKVITSTICSLYQVYWKYDAEVAEINPLAIIEGGGVTALDGKISVDNSALFRHKDLEAPRLDTVEARAAAKGLSYVELDGDIGIISNGAGLTMATMDQLAIAGGKPANFMDTGERILRDGIEDGLQIISEQPGLRAVLINVFGGGVRCDVIAQKITEAMARRSAFSLPVVVCLQGRNHEIGHQLIRESGHPALHLVETMEEAVRAVTRLGGTA
ncbi:MAG: ADP-forming succinate--CoA ligase subunit beta [Bacillota bacterium]